MGGGGLARSVGQSVRGGTGGMVGGLVFAAAATAGTALVGWLAVRGALPVFEGRVSSERYRGGAGQRSGRGWLPWRWCRWGYRW